MKNPYEYMKRHEGQIIPYKEFCDILELEELKGVQRTRQLKELSAFMDIKNNRGMISINKIYDKKELLLIEKKAKFAEYIEDLLIMYLAECDKKAPTLTFKDMAEYFYMVNSNYYKLKYNKNDIVYDLKMKTNSEFDEFDSLALKYSDTNLFFNITDRIIKDIIRKALKSLKQKSLILYHDTFKIYKTVKIAEDKYITKSYICNEEQREIFLDIRKNVMKKYDIEKTQDVIYMPKDTRLDYFKDLSNEMRKCDKLYNCDRYANAFTIEYGEQGIKHEYKRLKEDNREMLNYNVQYKLLTTNELSMLNSVLREQLVEKLIEQKY